MRGFPHPPATLPPCQGGHGQRICDRARARSPTRESPHPHRPRSVPLLHFTLVQCNDHVHLAPSAAMTSCSLHLTPSDPGKLDKVHSFLQTAGWINNRAHKSEAPPPQTSAQHPPAMQPRPAAPPQHAAVHHGQQHSSTGAKKRHR